MITVQKYFGNIWSLRNLTWDSGVRGHWLQDGDRWFFKMKNGAIMNFWQSTGTINFQGPEWASATLKKSLFPDGGIQTTRSSRQKKKTDA